MKQVSLILLMISLAFAGCDGQKKKSPLRNTTKSSENKPKGTSYTEGEAADPTTPATDEADGANNTGGGQAEGTEKAPEAGNNAGNGNAGAGNTQPANPTPAQPTPPIDPNLTASVADGVRSTQLIGSFDFSCRPSLFRGAKSEIMSFVFEADKLFTVRQYFKAEGCAGASFENESRYNVLIDNEQIAQIKLSNGFEYDIYHFFVAMNSVQNQGAEARSKDIRGSAAFGQIVHYYIAQHKGSSSISIVEAPKHAFEGREYFDYDKVIEAKVNGYKTDAALWNKLAVGVLRGQFAMESKATLPLSKELKKFAVEKRGHSNGYGWSLPTIQGTFTNKSVDGPITAETELNINGAAATRTILHYLNGELFEKLVVKSMMLYSPFTTGYTMTGNAGSEEPVLQYLELLPQQEAAKGRFFVPTLDDGTELAAFKGVVEVVESVTLTLLSDAAAEEYNRLLAFGKMDWKSGETISFKDLVIDSRSRTGVGFIPGEATYNLWALGVSTNEFFQTTYNAPTENILALILQKSIKGQGGVDLDAGIYTVGTALATHFTRQAAQTQPSSGGAGAGSEGESESDSDEDEGQDF